MTGLAINDLSRAEWSASPLATEDASPIPYSKVINDPIHGHIELEDYCMHVIDTPQFQRLRDLKQLGSAYYVFPGAAHNRFEHSIGVCYLAGNLVDHLRKAQPNLGITDNDVKCVKLAGLCHDLGHGPFSHIFDNEFMKQARPGFQWTHEVASQDMLDYLVAENEHVSLTPGEVRFIKDLIHGEPRGDYPQAAKRFLFDIVANKRNSIDVDKFDYIQRDCHNVGIKTSLDATRFMRLARVIDNQICFNQKESFNIYELFHRRFCLFKMVYTHRVGKAVEYMLCEALLAADKYLGISSSVDDMSRYIHMTDAIIREIERSTVPELAKSREIIHRLRIRELYRYVDQSIVPPEGYEGYKREVTPEAIVRFQEPGDDLTEDDVIIEWLKLGYAMQDQNPVDAVKFYNKWQPTQSFHIGREQISSFLPTNFQEITLRVFTRDNNKRQRVQAAFRKLVDHLNGSTSSFLDSGNEDEDDGLRTVPGSIEADRQSGSLSLQQTPGDLTGRRLFTDANGDPTTPSASPTPSSIRSVSRTRERGSTSAQGSPMRPHRLSPPTSTILPNNYRDIADSPATKKRKRTGEDRRPVVAPSGAVEH